ncbi:MAG: hypothetical protein ACK43K_04690 [Chitinophagales bacterium]
MRKSSPISSFGLETSTPDSYRDSVVLFLSIKMEIVVPRRFPA